MERVEINNDLTRSEPIREVRQTKDTRTGETTKKKFVAELERRLSRKKKKKSEDDKDKIILRDEENKDNDKKDNKSNANKKEKNKDNSGNKPTGSSDSIKGNEIDIVA